MTNKMTKRDFLTAILNNYDLTVAEKDFIKHELELLDKRSTSKANTEKARFDTMLMEKIYAFMNTDEQYTVTAIIKGVPECKDFTTQRVTPILSKMVDANMVMRERNKGVTYFTKVEEVEEG